MTKRYPILLVVAMLVGIAVASCNKDDDKNSSSENIAISSASSTSTLVNSFSLKANSDVMANLDSVYFTIDQERHLIYNADSLPMGTDVTHLCVSASYPSIVQSVRFEMRGGTAMGDSVVNYTSETNDSIDFSGTVKMVVTAYDGLHVANYDVRVNVHKMAPDSLYWDQMARRDLPNAGAGAQQSKTVKCGDQYLCLVSDGTAVTLSGAESAAQQTWTKKDLTLPFVPQINSFAATDEAIYLLDTAGELFASADNGDTWTDCGVLWHSILGGYDNRVLGVSYNGSTYCHDEYPRPNGFEPVSIESGFPVSGTSQLAMAQNDWVMSQQAMLMGGVLPDGRLSNAVWGYDGAKWGVLSSGTVLPAVAGATLFPYFTSVSSSIGRGSNSEVTWLLMGGRLADGTLNGTVYVSTTQGINWHEGASSVQLPDYLPMGYGAQAFIETTTLQVPKAPAWRGLRGVALPAGARRAASNKPITEWDCPYVYVFGGYDQNGVLFNNVWRGVLNQLTFKPLQ